MATINLSGSVGIPGSEWILGGKSLVLNGSDNTAGYHLLLPSEFSNKFLKITSSVTLTGPRNIIAPANLGQEYVVQNLTTGGQSLQVIATNGGGGGGTTGTGITITNGSIVSVIFDGTNYITFSSSTAAVGGDLSGTTTAATVFQAQNGAILLNPTSVSFASTVASPSVTQGASTIAAGQNLIVRAQNSTASLANGGNLVLSSGSSGTGTAGTVQLAVAGTTGLTLNANGTVAVANLAAGVVHSDSAGDLSSSPLIDADVSPSAAVAVSKLATGTAGQVLLNNPTPAPTWTTITGDVTFTGAGLTTVTALQGNSVLAQSLGAPQDGYVLSWNQASSKWKATAISSGSTALGGDVTGLSTSNTVTAIQNRAVASTTPTSFGQYNPVLIWNPSLSRYDVRYLTADDIAPGFSITGFSGSQVVEVGATITNPAMTASYSATPSSVTITNTDGLSSPTSFGSTPFTNFTYSQAFTSISVNHVNTFNIAAIGTGGITKNNNGVSFTWEARMFIGVGAAGANTSVTSSGLNAVLSNGAVLANKGLFVSAQGQSFNVTASGNKIYLLITGLYTQFTDTIANQPFAFGAGQAVSFVNAQGATVPMYLYESVNTLTAAFTIKPVS